MIDFINKPRVERGRSLRFYATMPDACVYLPEREAVSVFADPRASMDMATYARLIDLGFRRSGPHVYRPQCAACQACVPTRIPVAQFAPNRSQRRNLRANADLTVRAFAPSYREAHFRLYCRYQRHRHPGGGMEDPTPASYLHFLACKWSDTLFVEFRSAQHLLAVAVTDVLPQGLSAVYTFFDAQEAALGLGTFAILWQLAEARRRGLDYVYLGYWIAEHEKMRYKTRFRPIEGLVNGRWQRLDDQ